MSDPQQREVRRRQRRDRREEIYGHIGEYLTWAAGIGMFLFTWIALFRANFRFSLIHDSGLFILLISALMNLVGLFVVTAFAVFAAFVVMLIVNFTWPVTVPVAVIICVLKIAFR